MSFFFFFSSLGSEEGIAVHHSPSFHCMLPLPGLDTGRHGLLCVVCLCPGHVEGSGWVQEKPELCPDLGFHLSGRRALFQIEQMFLWAGGHQGKCLAQAGPVKFSFSPRSMKVLDFETGEVWPGWVWSRRKAQRSHRKSSGAPTEWPQGCRNVFQL